MRPSPKLLIFFVCRTHVSAETSVVPTYSLVKGASLRRTLYQQVVARENVQEAVKSTATGGWGSTVAAPAAGVVHRHVLYLGEINSSEEVA